MNMDPENNWFLVETLPTPIWQGLCPFGGYKPLTHWDRSQLEVFFALILQLGHRRHGLVLACPMNGWEFGPKPMEPNLCQFFFGAQPFEIFFGALFQDDFNKSWKKDKVPLRLSCHPTKRRGLQTRSGFTLQHLQQFYFVLLNSLYMFSCSISGHIWRIFMLTPIWTC